MRKKVFAFYRSILTVPQEEEFAQANLWKKSWESQGWECVMLNASHVSISPWSSAILARIMNLRQFNAGIPSEVLERMAARFVRWCGLHLGSGGWLSDYDVLNLGFTPEMADKIEKETDIAVPKSGHAWLVYATPKASADACRDFTFGEMFVPPDWTETLTESEILKIKKDYFTDLPLVHVNNPNPGEKKHDAMARILGEFLRPPVVEPPKKKSNRRGK